MSPQTRSTSEPRRFLPAVSAKKYGSPKVAATNSASQNKIETAIGRKRGEIGEALRLYFGKEQVRVELEIEQRRYGNFYWQTELGEKDLIELDHIRAARLRELTLEMNAMLDDLEAGDPGTRMTLTPIFDAGHAGPNVGFLSPDSLARMEELIADLAQHGPVDASRLLAGAQQILTPDEMALYRLWNAPENGLLRNQLVGFNATEDEFNAISRWPGFVNQGNSETGGEEQAELTLATQIGVQRLADLIRLRDPEVQTAVQDLHRLGLPLEQAEPLAVFRSQGVGAIQQVWSDPALPSPAKEERVLQIQQSYRAGIAALFRLSSMSPDETILMP